MKNIKDSQCGRIVQQIRPYIQSRLIKDYDTSSRFFDIHYDRVNQLKKKYQEPIKKQQQQARQYLQPMENNIISRSPFHDLTQRSNNLNNHADSVPLSSFRSSVGKGENLKQEYVRKVERMNQGISQKLTSIEEELERLKLQRMAQKSLAIETEHEKNMPKLHLMEISGLKQPEIASSPIKKVHLQIPTPKHQKITLQQQVQESQCRLMEEVKQGKVYSNEFRTLIHRIKNQISLDYQFTQLTLTIPRHSLVLIKEQIKKRHRAADLSFFEISAMEMDPLQPVATQPVTDISVTSAKLYEYYLRIEEHFQVKLRHKFERGTVEYLFMQIGGDEVTLGHLISYINMQTGRQFRNRALVKLLRRMEICTHKIDPTRFYLSLCL